MKKFALQIYRAVRNGRLAEPFNAAMVKKVCPGWSVNSYPTFLPKHAKGNPGGNSVLFIRINPGSYRTIKSLHQKT